MTFPSGAAPLSAREFQALLSRIDAQIKSVDISAGRIFQHSNRALAYLPPGLSDGLRATLEELGDKIAEFGAELGKLVAYPGNPAVLMDTAESWITRIGGPVSAMSGQLTTDQTRLDRFWKGPAAEAYAATLPTQQKAIDGINDAARSMDTNLIKAAGGIFALWVGLAVAFATYVAEMAAEAAAASTGVGAGPAAAAAALSTAKVIGLVTALVVGVTTFLTLVLDSLSALRQSLNANTPYPGGRWPRSNPSEFDDGSLADGDTTDWRIDVDD